MCEHRGGWPESVGADYLRHVGEVIVQLVVPPRQQVQLCLWDRAGIQVSMRRRDSLVLESVKHMHWHALRQPRAEVARQLELVAGSAAGTDERSGDQHDRRKLPLRRLLGERVDEERPTHRMANDDRAVV